MAQDQQETPETPAAPAAEGAQPPATPEVSTEISVGQTQFDLRGLTVEQGAQLYAALPTDYRGINFRAQADVIQRLLENYNSAIAINEPEGFFEQYTSALRAGRLSITQLAEMLKKDVADPAVQQMWGVLHAQAGSIPGAQVVEDTIIYGAMPAQAMDGFISTLAMPFRLAFALKDSAAEGLAQLQGGHAPEQARAFAAAYAAAMYAEAFAATEGPQTVMQRAAGFVDYGLAGIQWASSALVRIPIVGPLIYQCWQFVSNGLTNKGWDWAAAGTQVQEALASPMPEYSALLNQQTTERVLDGARAGASEMMRAAGEVAGIQTAGVTNMLEHGGIYRDANGTYQTIRIKDGQIVSEPVKDAEGNPITTPERLRESWGNAFGAFGEVAQNLTDGDITKADSHQALAVGAGAVGAGVAATRAAPHLANGAAAVARGTGQVVRGAAAGMVQGTVDVASRFTQGGADLREAQRMGTQARDLLAREQELTRQITDLEEKGSLSRSETRRLNTLRTQLGDAENPAKNSVRGRIGEVREFAQNNMARWNQAAAQNPELSRAMQTAARMETSWTHAAATRGADTARSAASASRELVVAGEHAGARAASSATTAVAAEAAEQSLGMLGRAGRFGGRVLGPAGTVLGLGLSANDAFSDDERRQVTGRTELGTVGGAAGAGALLGTFIFPGVGTLAGGAIGAGVGVIASFFTGMGAGALYDRAHPARATTVEMDPALARANLAQEAQTLAARTEAAQSEVEALRNRGQKFLNASVQLGGTVPASETGSLQASPPPSENRGGFFGLFA